ncbi:MAG: hypothetical protein AAF126_00390 [Chloroflexota bacterium]
MRKAPVTREQLEARRKSLKQEIIETETAMEDARAKDSLSAYEQAKLLHDVAVDDMRFVIEKLHPYAMQGYINKYGDFILPTLEDEDERNNS